MISGTPFHIANIDEEWHRIKPLALKADPSDNEGEHLRQTCRSGGALCLVSDDAVLVLSLISDRYGRGTELFVRLGASWGEHGAIQRNDEHLDAIARELGAHKIVCFTARRGLEHALGPEWSLRYVAFEREVNGQAGRAK
jgi:hypothetical protein